jgi:hypothetical protein
MQIQAASSREKGSLSQDSIKVLNVSVVVEKKGRH